MPPRTSLVDVCATFQAINTSLYLRIRVLSLRTSRATWMIEAGANPKDVQGQMGHSRIQTTLDIYAQFVPESQRRAVEKTSQMVPTRIAAARAARTSGAAQVVN